MAQSRRKRGSVTARRGKLMLFIYWHDPEQGALKPYRWSIQTREEETESNRLALEKRLDNLNSKIEADAFYPCREFPDHKIAQYCRCPSCLSVSPLSQAYIAPRTLKELFVQYKVFEEARANGDQRIIEKSTLVNKLMLMRQLEKNFDFMDKEDGSIYEYAPLTDYAIRELTPEAVKDWLLAFQNRQELVKDGGEPNRTKYLKNLQSVIEQSLEYGRLKRYWKDHPLLDYKGVLIQASKEERNRQMNSLMFKPFSLIERDNILEWLKNYYLQCPEKTYNGKEKLRRFFIYHYCVIGFNTGLRSPSEMTALAWDNIDYKNRSIHVCQSREASGRIDDQIIRDYTKTIRHRHVPINQMVLDSLRALEEHRQEDQPWLFWNPRASKDNPFILSNGWAPLTGEKRIRYSFDKCLDKLKVKGNGQQGQYRMRHTFTTLMLDHTNFSDAKVAALIGDNVETMKRHYAGFCENRWRNEDDINQMDAMNNKKNRRLKVVK